VLTQCEFCPVLLVDADSCTTAVDNNKECSRPFSFYTKKQQTQNKSEQEQFEKAGRSSSSSRQ